jgi:hypothetical protein
MSTIRGSANYPGLLPFKLTDERPPNRPTILENERFANGQPSLRKRASRALYRFVIAFCGGVAATLAWQWYGDASREMIAKSYPQLGWLATQPVSTAQNAPGMFGLVAPAVPFDQQQLKASLEAMRQSIDRIVAGDELIMRSIDQIVTKVVADHEQMARNSGQTATGITVGQGEMTRSIEQTAINVAASQKQIAGSIDQTATDISQAPSVKASGITVESRSLQPTARLDAKRTEARPPHTSSDRGKLVSAVSGHDRSSEKQVAGSIDQTATDSSQVPSAKTSGIAAESPADRASLQPIARLDVEPTEARPPHTSSERGKLISGSGHDRSSQKHMPGSVDQTTTDSSQAPSARASGTTVESRADRASLQPTARFDVSQPRRDRHTNRQKEESWSPRRAGMIVPVKTRWRVASIRPPPTVLRLPRPRPVALR